MAKRTLLSEIVMDEVSVVGKGANQGAHIVLMKAITKKEDGEDFPAKAFAYVPDSEKPSTWKLRLWDSLVEKETPSRVGAAVVALGKEIRENKLKILSEDMPAVKKNALSAWLKVNSDKTREDAPEVIKIMKLDLEGKTFDEIMAHKETLDQLWDAVYTLEDSLYSIMHNTKMDEKAEKLNETTAQFQSKISELRKGGDMGELEKIKKDLEDLTKKLADLQGVNETLQNENDDLKKQLEEALKKEKSADGDVNKAEMPENIRKQFEAMEKENADNKKLVKELFEKQENEAFIKKAADYVHLNINAEEFGPVLKKISHALSEEEMTQVTTFMASADEALAKSKIFEEEGSGAPSAGSAIAKMDAKAKEIMTRDGITKEKAFVKVMEEDPKLYDKYIEETSR